MWGVQHVCQLQVNSARLHTHIVYCMYGHVFEQKGCWYILGVVCHFSHIQMHLLRVQCEIHMLEWVKVQKMTKIYSVWDTQHYDRCMIAHNLTHNLTHIHTRAPRVEIYRLGGVGMIARTPCSAAFSGCKQNMQWWDHKTQRWKKTIKKHKHSQWDGPETDVLILVYMKNWIHKHLHCFCENGCPADSFQWFGSS